MLKILITKIYSNNPTSIWTQITLANIILYVFPCNAVSVADVSEILANRKDAE